jgi:transposase
MRDIELHQRELGCHDHAAQRTWRHLDTCPFQTHLRARLPRVECPEHGVGQVAAPWVRRSKLAPIKPVALILQRHLPNILTYCRHPITNGVVEGLSRCITTSKRKACGYRSRENFKTAIYFFRGGLNLDPQ